MLYTTVRGDSGSFSGYVILRGAIQSQKCMVLYIALKKWITVCMLCKLYLNELHILVYPCWFFSLLVQLFGKLVHYHWRAYRQPLLDIIIIIFPKRETSATFCRLQWQQQIDFRYPPVCQSLHSKKNEEVDDREQSNNVVCNTIQTESLTVKTIFSTKFKKIYLLKMNTENQNIFHIFIVLAI